MVNGLLLYSPSSGHRDFSKKVDYVKKALSMSFDRLDYAAPSSAYEAFQREREAIGRYSDIAYAVSPREKKAIGKLSYYKKAAHEAFANQTVKIEIAFEDGTTFEEEVPFFLVLNGQNVGGFKVNRQGNPFDGTMEAYITKKGPFGGLTHYLTGKGLRVVSFKKIAVKPLRNDLPWCLDGELGPFGEAEILFPFVV